MSSFKELIKSVSHRHNEKINKYCSSLFSYFNLFQFYHYEIKNDGRFTFFHSSYSWSEYYEANQFYLIDPYFRHPKHFQDGVILIKDAQENSTKKILTPGKDKFNVGFILKLIKKTHDGMEGFGFSSQVADEMQLSFLLSELPLLHTFTEKFREDNPLLFTTLKDNQVNLAKLVGPSFEGSSLESAPNSQARNIFLRKLGIGIGDPLTPIEKSVMKFLILGYSAGQIGSQIYLSRRTIEHHVERIKDKLDCSSKAELVQKARELEKFGFLKI